jgi:hypothetical protein
MPPVETSPVRRSKQLEVFLGDAHGSAHTGALRKRWVSQSPTAVAAAGKK